MWASQCVFLALYLYGKISRCPTVSLLQVLKQLSFGFHVPYIQRLAILEAVRSEKKRKMEKAPEFVVYALFSA
jgi:hypothetical protein